MSEPAARSWVEPATLEPDPVIEAYKKDVDRTLLRANLELALQELHRAGVEFVIVGGIAATIHGSARVTQDLDIVYARTPENIARLAASLAPHRPYLRGAPPGLPFRWDAETIRRGLNFTLTTTLGDVDLLGEIVGGGSYADLLPHYR
jgi:hypothetical protein